jgi:hypothetical protein
MHKVPWSTRTYIAVTSIVVYDLACDMSRDQVRYLYKSEPERKGGEKILEAMEAKEAKAKTKSKRRQSSILMMDGNSHGRGSLPTYARMSCMSWNRKVLCSNQRAQELGRMQIATLPYLGTISSVGRTMRFPFCAVLSSSGAVAYRRKKYRYVSKHDRRRSVRCPQTKETARSAQVGKVLIHCVPTSDQLSYLSGLTATTI